MSIRNLWCALVLAVLSSATLAQGPFPDSLVLKGRAEDASGVPIDGRHDLVIHYFDSVGQQELSVERRPGVDFTAGRFEIKLGATETLSLQELFAENAELHLEIHLDGIEQHPRISVLPAGHSQESRLLLAGRKPQPGELHWKGYRSPSLSTAVQAATLSPTAGRSGAPAVITNPHLIDAFLLGESRAVRDLPRIDPHRRPEVPVAEVNPPRHETLYDEEGHRFGTRTVKIQDPLAGLPPLEGGAGTPGLVVDVEGIGNVNGVLPPDTEGTVGPSHYVQVVNLAFGIFDKDGNQLTGPSNTNTLWAGFGGPCDNDNSGDAIFLYDESADRYVLTQFAVGSGQAVCFAVSQTPDPTGSYYLYQVNTQRFPDYFKIGVWPDPDHSSYFMTTNSGFQGQYDVYAVDRDNMLAGLPPRTTQFFQNFDNLFMPADLDGDLLPPAGSPGLLFTFRDGGEPYFSTPPTDSLDLYEYDVDWDTPGDSTFAPAQIFTPPELVEFNWTVCGFFSQNCLPQPGTSVGLDSASWWPMQRLQYRNFGGHETLVGGWTVDVTGSPDHAAPRWFELRRSGGPWSIHQQGTHAPDAEHRFMPSVAMDGDGNLAIGYSVTSETTFPSLRYATRAAGDPPGTLQAEAVMIDGTGSQTHGASRWGDYASLEVDPEDDCTFWFTSEYIETTGSAPWQTRIGSFVIPGCGGMRVTPTAQTFCNSIGATSFAIELFEQFGGSTDLELIDCPAGATCAFTSDPVVFPNTTSTLDITGLAGVPAGVYAMTVRATDLGDPSNTRDVPLQLTLYDAVPTAPALTSPTDGATDVVLLPTLGWSVPTQGVEYSLEVATDAAFANIVYSAGPVTGTSHTLSQALDPVSSYFWRVTSSNPCGAGSWSAVFGFTTRAIPPFLLVDDDDNGPDVRSSYTEVMDSLGLPYDVWDTGNSDDEPSASESSLYEAIIWFSGDEFGGAAGPGTDGEAALATFLDQGGCLVLSSQDYHYDRTLTTFMADYLGVASASNDVGQDVVTGAGLFAGAGPYTLVYPFTNYSDWIVPDASAQVSFLGDATGEQETAITKTGAGYGSAFFSFPLEALPTVSDFRSVLSRALYEVCGMNLPLFTDDFENGDLAAWSVFEP